MIDVKTTLNNAEEEMSMACMYLEEQLSHIRAGRANVALVDGIKVESYGTTVPINQVANISTPDPRTMAIINSSLGITPDNNGEIIRLCIPVPTEERRRELAKQCNGIGEKAKVSVRKTRGEYKDTLKKAVKDGLAEDEQKDAEEKLQKLHDRYIKKIDEILAEKNKEIMTV